MQTVPTLRRASWAEHLNKIAGATVIALLITAFVREPNLRALLKQIVLGCFISAIAAKEIADFPALWVRALKKCRSDGSFFFPPSRLIAPEFLGWFKTAAKLAIGFYRWAARRPAFEGQVQGVPITYLKRSGYSVLTPLALLSLFVDVPVGMVILPALGVPAEEQFVLRTTILLIGLVVLALLLGDKWHLSRGEHYLAYKKLYLNIGVRFRASIPYAAIQDVQRISRTEKVYARWSKRELTASPFDKPNVRLTLSSHPDTCVVSWGCAFNCVRDIYLYVDEPEDFLAKIGKEIHVEA